MRVKCVKASLANWEFKKKNTKRINWEDCSSCGEFLSGFAGLAFSFRNHLKHFIDPKGPAGLMFDSFRQYGELIAVAGKSYCAANLDFLQQSQAFSCLPSTTGAHIDFLSFATIALWKIINKFTAYPCSVPSKWATKRSNTAKSVA